MRIIGGIEAQNDRLVQIWASKQRSYISGKPAECGHHFHSRHNKLLRWDLKNIIPLTLEEHQQIHTGKLRYKMINPCNVLYLDRLYRKDYKDYLLERGMTEQDFILECNKKLKEAISD